MKTILRAVGLMSVACGASAWAGGPLTPPSGPIVPVYKTLDEVEPRKPVQSLSGDATTTYVITQPGSYYLTGSISVPTGHNAIAIVSSDVTLDLSGFRLAGNNAGSSGIVVGSGSSHVTIRNGHISEFRNEGINASGALGVTVDNITVRFGIGRGISVGPLGIISNCNVFSCSLEGIYAVDRATITDCVVNSTGVAGFRVGDASEIRHCIAAYNQTDGFVIGNNSIVSHCVGRGNTAWGFNLGSTVTIDHCSAAGNTGGGFLAVTAGNFDACTASGNGVDGFRAIGENAIFTNCNSYTNGEDGFEVQSFGTLTNCTASRNGTTSTDGAGIRFPGAAARADQCTLNSNDVGIKVIGTQNIVTRCSFSYNPTATIAPNGNNVAQMVTTPGNGFSTTNPFANVAH